MEKMDMRFYRKLPTPKEVKEEYPVSKKIEELKAERDEVLKNIFEGKDGRCLLVIGPCSADHEDPVIDYISRLRTVQDKVADKIFIVPRIYTNKPRTVGTGYKGMLHQPDPDKPADMLEGILAIRRLHKRAAEECGFTCADEMLYPENHRYLSDLLSYVAVGARSSEDQQHRLTAAGIGIPAGITRISNWSTGCMKKRSLRTRQSSSIPITTTPAKSTMNRSASRRMSATAGNFRIRFTALSRDS